MRKSLQEVVDVRLVALNPHGFVLVADTTDANTLTFVLCDGWVGEFDRVRITSQVFALRRVRPATDQDQRQAVCASNALWRRPEFLEADRAICAFLPLAHPTPVCEKPTSGGAGRHES